MALPILETATYELTLPSADVVVKYRPFLVKEEKVLLQALESNDDVEIKVYQVSGSGTGTVANDKSFFGGYKIIT